MKRIFLTIWLVLTMLVLVISCTAPAQTLLRGSNPKVKVELLFEIDGCKVYRFYDGNAPRYFTKCKEGDSSVGWVQSCGKNCSFYSENITSYTKGN